MASFYSAADLFVVGSHHEGSGYALMERARADSIPVVTGIPTFRLRPVVIVGARVDAQYSAACGAGSPSRWRISAAAT